MSAAITATVVGGIGGALISSSGAQSAANTEASASQAGIAAQQNEFQVIQSMLSPYIGLSSTALPGYATAQKNYAGALGQYAQTNTQLGNLTGANGNAAQQTAINGLKTNPTYLSAMQLGQQSILANASATGGLRGGNTIASLGYLPGQIMSNVMGQQIGNLGASLNATSGLLNGYGTQVSQFGNLASLGENASAMAGNAGMQATNNITNLTGLGASAQAGATLAGSNAASTALTSIGTYLGSSGGQSALSALMASPLMAAGGIGANATAAGTTTPQDLIAGYTGT